MPFPLFNSESCNFNHERIEWGTHYGTVKCPLCTMIAERNAAEEAASKVEERLKKKIGEQQGQIDYLTKTIEKLWEGENSQN